MQAATQGKEKGLFSPKIKGFENTKKFEKPKKTKEMLAILITLFLGTVNSRLKKKQQTDSHKTL